LPVSGSKAPREYTEGTKMTSWRRVHTLLQIATPAKAVVTPKQAFGQVRVP
jgi:hypothetical protein